MSQQTSKTTVDSVIWSSFGRYKVGMNVSYNNSTWVNSTGKNSEPGVGSDWVSVGGDIGVKQIDRYENIPLEVGNYSVIVVDSEQGYEIDLKTNVYKYEDDTQLNVLDFVTNSESSYMIINRMILSAEGEIDDEEQNPIDLKFVDYFYDSEGVFIGFLRLSDNNSKVIINENIFLSKSVVFDNVYINTKDLGYSVTDLVYKGFLKVSINNTNFNNGLVTIPVEFPNGFEHIDSSVYLGSKKISGYEINVISDDSNNFLGLRDYSGDLINSNLKGDLFIYIKYKEKDTQGISKTLNNTAVNVLNLEVSDLSHSNSMKLTFQEVYGTFTGTVFNAGSSNISDFANLKNITSELDAQNVDFVFSAEGFPNILKNYYFNNSLSVLPIGSNSNVRQDLTDAIDIFPSNYIAVTARADDDDDGSDPLGTSYGFGTEFYEPTWSTDLIAQGLTNWSNDNRHSQSIATAIVAGKLKYIKDQTGASWVNVREAARRSASNYGNYNIYQGFGKIDTALAISLMPTVISERSQELADYWEAVTPFNQDLKFEDKSDYTPLVKKDLDGDVKIGGNLDVVGNLGVKVDDPTKEIDIIGSGGFGTIRLLGAESSFGEASILLGSWINRTWSITAKPVTSARYDLIINYDSDAFVGDFGINNNGNRIFTVDETGVVTANNYKSTGDISTTAFTFVNGNTGDLDYTVSNGRLIMNGTFNATGTSSDAIIGTLPLGARPSVTRAKTFYQGNGVLELEINANGQIKKTTNSTETFNVDFEMTLDLASV